MYDFQINITKNEVHKPIFKASWQPLAQIFKKRGNVECSVILIFSYIWNIIKQCLH